MPDLLTVGNESLIDITPPIAPITNPVGPLPSGATLSIGNAAAQAQAGVETPGAFLGIDFGSEQAKNLIFLGLVGIIFWKYGRRIFNGA